MDKYFIHITTLLLLDLFIFINTNKSHRHDYCFVLLYQQFFPRFHLLIKETSFSFINIFEKVGFYGFYAILLQPRTNRPLSLHIFDII